MVRLLHFAIGVALTLALATAILAQSPIPGLILVTQIPPGPSPPGNEYFEDLVDRADFWKGYSLRPVMGEPISSPYYENQLDRPNQGGYLQSNSAPLAIVYDAGVDAAEVSIPPFAALGVITEPMDTVTTRLIPSIFSSNFVVNAQLRVDSEIMLIQSADPSGTVPRGLNVLRAQYGTSAASHADNTDLYVVNTSLQNQWRGPVGTADGFTYFFTWDICYAASFVNKGLAGNKTFQFSTSTGDDVWFELKTMMNGGTGTYRPPGFNALVHVGAYVARSYVAIGGDPNWALTPTLLGPGVTNNNALAPNTAAFLIFPNRWTRHWVRIVQQANNYDPTDWWVADSSQPPAQMYTGFLNNVREDLIQKFWLEFNDSQSRLPTQWVTNPVDLVAYVRNLAILRNPPSDVTPLLEQPSGPAC